MRSRRGDEWETTRERERWRRRGGKGLARAGERGDSIRLGRKGKNCPRPRLFLLFLWLFPSSRPRQTVSSRPNSPARPARRTRRPRQPPRRRRGLDSDQRWRFFSVNHKPAFSPARLDGPHAAVGMDQDQLELVLSSENSGVRERSTDHEFRARLEAGLSPLRPHRGRLAAGNACYGLHSGHQSVVATSRRESLTFFVSPPLPRPFTSSPQTMKQIYKEEELEIP